MMLNMYSRMLVKGYRNLSLPIFFPSNLFHSSISFNNKRESTVFKFPKLLALNNLQYVDGSRKKRKRWGRGTGSGRGKLCGYGHQKSRSTPRGFEGGQTPLYKRIPKLGFRKYNKRKLAGLNLERLQQFIDMGRLSFKDNELITMRDLLNSGIVSSVKQGIKLLAGGKSYFKSPIHLEVSFASTEAVKAVEAAGGTVTCVHFNRLALRALLKPFKFELYPHRARPTPKIMSYYLDYAKSGYLSPEVQIRNLKLFGSVTSEERYRKEHEDYMNYNRYQLKKSREEMLGSPEKLKELLARKVKTIPFRNVALKISNSQQ